MSRLPYAFIHGLLLLGLLVVPKLFKSADLARGGGYWPVVQVLLPDLIFVVLAEITVWGLANGARGVTGRWVRASWGLLLIPLMVIALVEHRFFLATGSLMDWGLLFHGLSHADELGGVVASEIPVAWWVALFTTVPVGLFAAAQGWRRESVGLAGWRALLVGLLAGALLGGAAAWRGPRPSDSRLASLRGSFYSELALGAIRQVLAPPDVEPDKLDYPLPDTLEVASGPNTRPLNVVFIVLESVRAESTTPYNPTLDTSPFLDELARTGIKVERGYTTLPHTTKSLVPVLCGVPPDIRQALTETVPGAIPVPCLATLLGEQGYNTAFFQPATRTFEQRATTIASAGFQRFVSREDLDLKRFQSPNYLGVEEKALNAPLLEWVDEQTGPFFLGILTLITHHDYKLPKGYPMQQFEGVSERVNNYYNAIRYTDAWLRGLFAEFEARGLMENTVFFIIGDHGEGHGEHGRKGHDEVLYEQGVHVPLIVWGPGIIQQPQVVTGLRQNIDLVPTAIELLGLNVTKGKFFGRSLLSPPDPERTLYLSCWYDNRCLARLKGDQKLIYFYDRAPTEIFDLSVDPLEENSLAADADPSVTDALVAEMEAWKAEVRSLWATHQRLRNTGYILFDTPTPPKKLEGRLGREIDLLGYDVKEPIKPGSTTRLTLWFKVLDNLGWHWKFAVSVLQQGGPKRLRIRSSEDRYPIYTWVPGQYRKVEIDLTVPSDLPAGQAKLLVQVAGSRGRKLEPRGPSADRENRALVVPVTVE